jgi:hypothetical protein
MIILDAANLFYLKQEFHSRKSNTFHLVMNEIPIWRKQSTKCSMTSSASRRRLMAWMAPARTAKDDLSDACFATISIWRHKECSETLRMSIIQICTFKQSCTYDSRAVKYQLTKAQPNRYQVQFQSLPIQLREHADRYPSVMLPEH